MNRTSRLIVIALSLALTGCAGAKKLSYREREQIRLRAELKDLRKQHEENENRIRVKKYREMVQEEQFDDLIFAEKQRTRLGGKCELGKDYCEKHLRCSFEGQYFNDKFGRCKLPEYAQSYKVWLKQRYILKGY